MKVKTSDDYSASVVEEYMKKLNEGEEKSEIEVLKKEIQLINMEIRLMDGLLRTVANELVTLKKQLKGD